MEVVYPGHVKLTDKEKTNICYLSFPDSNSGCMGDTQFHFRIRRCPGRRSVVQAHTDYNKDCPAALQSVVLLSKLPFVTLYNYIVSVIAPEYFDNGEPCLEAACHDIDQWPDPCPGETLNLPIMGTVVQVRLPSRSDKVLTSPQIKNPSVPTMPANNILPSVSEVDVYSAFLPVLPHIQMLWELVLIGEPLVVMANSPTICSGTVQALVSTIWPFKYCMDFRPYFTIHDSEFREYTTKTQAPPAVILGVTNPFFAKTLQHWPHVLRIGELAVSSPKTINKLKKVGTIKTLDSKPGYPDKEASGGSECNALKRYLLELTQSFMIPLERYVASLMPLQRNISPHKGPPRLKSFDTEAFLKTIEHSGPQLTSGLKGDWIALYRRFFRSGNFEGWLRFRQEEVNQKLQALHLEVLCQADLLTWIQDKQEVEIVDLILRLREKLAKINENQLPVSNDMLSRLQHHHDMIVCSLPEDLQSVLKSNHGN
ncbi:hypothetical protein LSH36_30g02036 [Paralvinella palmiformis]|uniref:UDENN domain-containing protein n=1 Tax=Paralvinella palmiformis TaxID=53620 RepID=A0AAD9K8Z4_9ANNE|nr:hypothetical protein LSH36_30g02036 [Paralvinella palmiformis]